MLRYVPLLLALLGLPGVAAAQAALPQDEARALAKAGHEHYKAGRFDEAIRSFEAAERVFHAPTHLLYVARAHDRAGRWLAARETYRAVVAEPLGADAPAAFREAQTDSRLELASLELRIPRVRLFSRSPLGAASVDGRALSAAERNERVLLDPGSHEIVVEVGGRKLTTRLSLSPGDDRTLDLDASGAAPPPAVPARAEGSWLPGVVVGATGVVSLGVATGLGVASLDEVSRLAAACPQKVQCPASLEPAAEQARALGHASTALFVVGGALAVTGVVLLAVRPGASGPVKVRAGVGALSIEGTF